MLKKLKPMILAILIGCGCAFYLFKEVEHKAVNTANDNLIAVQIGVFSKEENALNMNKNYGGIVENDNGIYRVYYAILEKDDNIAYITNYLDNMGVSYYLKEINTSKDLIKKGQTREELMRKSEDKEAKLTLSRELLKIYGGDA